MCLINSRQIARGGGGHTGGVSVCMFENKEMYGKAQNKRKSTSVVVYCRLAAKNGEFDN